LFSNDLVRLLYAGSDQESSNFEAIDFVFQSRADLRIVNGTVADFDVRGATGCLAT
jgi:hypothetical protein